MGGQLGRRQTLPPGVVGLVPTWNSFLPVVVAVVHLCGLALRELRGPCSLCFTDQPRLFQG